MMKNLYLLQVALALSLAACADPQPIETHSHQGTKVAADHFTDGDYKPHSHDAMVEFSYDALPKLEIGETVGINMIVEEEYAAGAIMLEAVDADGVSVFGATRTLRLNAADGTSHDWRIEIEAERPGTHYVGLIATVELDDGFMEVRTSAIRVDVIDPNPGLELQKAGDETVETQQGEPVVMMEAIETIEN
ncbi:MAG: hypothetical protein AAFP81_00565 [Pseudomonadota bacterium]